MNKKIKRNLAILLTILLLLGQNLAVGKVLAAPDLPDEPDNVPTQQVDPSPTPEPTPVVPDIPEEPDNAVENAEPSATPTPTESPAPTPSATPEPEYTTAENTQTPGASEVDTDSGDENTGDNAQDNQVGGATIDTGNAEGEGSILNTGNTNVSLDGEGTTIGDEGTDISIISEGNGEGSENTGTIAIEENDTTVQENTADIQNELEVDANSGNNSASRNVGGDNEIDTGNATAVGTIVNSVNTNIAGAMVSEFDITDDQNGDLILDYEANCVSGCGSSIDLVNDENGSDSTNAADLDLANNSTTFQSNEVIIENDLILAANTGNNTADNNVGGDNSIDTGNATVNGNVINMLNNNIAGNVIYGVVNILDDFVGDIIVPEKYASAYTANNILIGNTDNGTGSENSGQVMLADNESFSQTNDADIFNNLVIDANTGGNKTSDNTNGNNSIDTGNVNVDASILNIANNNIIGGDWWIVLINEAGNWFGKIFTPEGALNGGNFAAKGGASSENSDGSITLSNNGNSSGSTNTASLDQESNSEVVQSNKAKIINNIYLSANTGDNSASRNTGGDNDIETGDANIQFNLINFLNNNFAGGNVYLTVVNVFGSWTGDFITPGAEKPVTSESDESDSDSDTDTGVGGNSEVPSNTADNSTSNNSGSSGDSSSSSNDSSESTSTSSVLSSQIVNYVKADGKIASGVTDENPFGIIDTAKASDGSDDSTSRRINLAWVVLLLPAYIILRVIRSRVSS